MLRWPAQALLRWRAARPRAVRITRRQFLATAAATHLLPQGFAHAAGRGAVLRVMGAGAPNAVDSFSPGLNRESIQVSWNVYDRLIRFAPKALGEGLSGFDYFTLQPEAAQGYDVADGGRTLRFFLRPDATFHDGTPVRAEDVKFSLDRVLASPIGRAQFATGSMTDPKQFVIEDDLTLRIDLPQPDRFALPNLALTYPIIVNATAARAHASADDPFAAQWLRRNVAGGGAYQLAQWQMGEYVRFARFDGWRSGLAPGFAEVLWQTVPAGETRQAALMRGDADLVQDVAPRDVGRLAAQPGVRVAGVPTTSFHFIAMNTQVAPFSDVRIRRAIAMALPYRDMFTAALAGRGQPLWGGASVPEGTQFPQPMGYDTDPEAARRLLADAGLPDGFDTTFAFDMSLSAIAEPVAVLAQEALAKIGIRIAIERVPTGQLGARLQDRAVPFYFEASTAFLADPDYFFRIFYSGPTRWNFGAYENADFAARVARTRFETDPLAYGRDVSAMIAAAKRDLPMILLWHPMLDVAMRNDVDGYAFAFHRMLDIRPLQRS